MSKAPSYPLSPSPPESPPKQAAKGAPLLPDPIAKALANLA
jgi:hypothetical protein